eukprot:SAG31_NODE_4087_length_3601_cov_3.169903_2_plen_64_part_00
MCARGPHVLSRKVTVEPFTHHTVAVGRLQGETFSISTGFLGAYMGDSARKVPWKKNQKKIEKV